MPATVWVAPEVREERRRAFAEASRKLSEFIQTMVEKGPLPSPWFRRDQFPYARQLLEWVLTMPSRGKYPGIYSFTEIDLARELLSALRLLGVSLLETPEFEEWQEAEWWYEGFYDN